MYQGRRLESVIAALAVEITGGQATKFMVDEWDQLSFSVPISLPESNQQVRDLTTLRLHADSPTSQNQPQIFLPEIFNPRNKKLLF